MKEEQSYGILWRIIISTNWKNFGHDIKKRNYAAVVVISPPT